MLDFDLVHLVLLPLGLGLLGFIEPCSVGASLLFLRYVEGAPLRRRVLQAGIFTLVRALVLGALGVAAALVGVAEGVAALALFGLGLSLPLALVILWVPARRLFDRLLRHGPRAERGIGLVLVIAGVWSVWQGTA